MSMKRILLVSPFPPPLGGISVSVRRLHDVLIKSGYIVVGFNTQYENRIFNKSKTLKFLKYLSLPLFLMTQKRFDVIHFHISGVFPKVYVTLWRSFFSENTRFIITIHGQIRHILTSKIGYFSLRNFDRIICVKPGDSIDLPKHLKQKTVEVPSFILPAISDNLTGKLSEPIEAFLKRDTFKLLINGFIICNQNFFDLYGFRDAIILLEQLRENGKNADLIIIVLGYPYSSECQKYIDSLKNYCISKKLNNNLLWIENVNMELWPLLKKVHLFLRPTKSDGDALSIRESLYLKIPVITSDVVPRPVDAIIYDLNSESDFLNKTISVIENHSDYVSKIGDNNISFAEKIIEQYEN